MPITIKLFATLRQGRFESKEFDYISGITVGQIIEKINISPEEAAIILVNGRHSNQDQELFEGDTLALFPLLGGG